MALSKTMETAIVERDLGKIYSSFYTILLSDPSFESKKFDEALEIVKSKNIPGFMQPFNGKGLLDKSEWNHEYWDKLASELIDNFSEQRIKDLKAVSAVVYPAEKKKEETYSTTTTQKKTNQPQVTVTKETSGNGKLIAALAVVVILLLILIIVLVK